MARVEAMLSQIQSDQLESLTEELEMTKGQIISEALALWVKAIAETKCGRRVAIVDQATNETVCTYTSPALSQVEWVTNRMTVSPEQLKAMADMVKNPPEPTATLRRAMARPKMR